MVADSGRFLYWGTLTYKFDLLHITNELLSKRKCKQKRTAIIKASDRCESSMEE